LKGPPANYEEIPLSQKKIIKDSDNKDDFQYAEEDE
jgi:hypothetical protein